jgi:hypothetical protein
VKPVELEAAQAAFSPPVRVPPGRDRADRPPVTVHHDKLPAPKLCHHLSLARLIVGPGSSRAVRWMYTLSSTCVHTCAATSSAGHWHVSGSDVTVHVVALKLQLEVESKIERSESESVGVLVV